MTTPKTIPQSLQTAVEHHKAGRRKQAEQAYRQVLEDDPNQPDALHLLGVMAFEAGRNDIALDLISRAIAANGNRAEYHGNLGNVLAALGRLDEAIAACRKAVALRPSYAEGHYYLGNALRKADRMDEAIAAFRAAIAQRSEFAEAYNNLGNAVKSKGLNGEAIACYRRAIAIQPKYVDAYNNLGIVLGANGQLDEAIALLRHCVALQPEGADGHHNLGNALSFKGELDEAIVEIRAAIALRPAHPQAYCNLSIALRRNGNLDEAVAAARQAMALQPQYFEACNNLGNALKEKGLFEEAIAVYRQAIAMKPTSAIGHCNLGSSLLLEGDFETGWPEYEWRWQAKEYYTAPRNFTQPRWDGSDLAGRRILTWAEQGFGDTIQFARYLPILAARGRVICECQPQLMRLFTSLPSGMQLVAHGQDLPEFDVHCAVMSLPTVLRTTLSIIPNNVPYLSHDPTLRERWRSRLPTDKGLLKIGLSWAGNPKHLNDRTRSMPLATLAPLASISDLWFCSLQKGSRSVEAAGGLAGMPVADWSSELNDFADTASLVAGLDLVITVDTAVAHLAGAMGKPVWVMVPFIPDWRWMRGRSESPWYPTMRLFRQDAYEDWQPVIARIVEALREFKSSARPGVASGPLPADRGGCS
jgi:tetratricopeptide (TPR) repeat protein